MLSRSLFLTLAGTAALAAADSLQCHNIEGTHGKWSWMCTYTDGNQHPYSGSGAGLFNDGTPGPSIGIGGGYILNWDNRSGKNVPWISSANGLVNWCCSDADKGNLPNPPDSGHSAVCNVLVGCNGSEGH